MQMTLSQQSFIPEAEQSSSQLRIQSPSPQPYEPNSATFLPPRLPLQSLNIGSNSDSSSISAPIAGQPKATASSSLSFEGLNSAAV